MAFYDDSIMVTFLKVNFGARPAFSTGCEFPLGASTLMRMTMMMILMMIMMMWMMMVMMMMVLEHLRQQQSASRAQLTKTLQTKTNLLSLKPGATIVMARKNKFSQFS